MIDAIHRVRYETASRRVGSGALDGAGNLPAGVRRVIRRVDGGKGTLAGLMAALAPLMGPGGEVWVAPPTERDLLGDLVPFGRVLCRPKGGADGIPIELVRYYPDCGHVMVGLGLRAPAAARGRTLRDG